MRERVSNRQNESEEEKERKREREKERERKGKRRRRRERESPNFVGNIVHNRGSGTVTDGKCGGKMREKKYKKRHERSGQERTNL